ncbi:MAG: MlaA family lipoprotein [Ramlibacter sp.]
MSNAHHAAPSRRTAVAGCAILCAGLLAGCAIAPAADPRDPMEPFNRKVDSFNRGLDQAAFKPAAKAYENALPSVIRTGVSNFFGNLGDAWSAVNSLLQLKPGDAAQNSMRFATNTVLGLGGVLDISTPVGIERHKEDFGTTLAHWGVPQGPYVVLPFFGPATLRDAAALPVDLAGYPLSKVTPVADRNALNATRAIDARARMLPLDTALDEALDPYTFMRDAYLQHRSSQVDDAKSGRDDAPLAEHEGE